MNNLQDFEEYGHPSPKEVRFGMIAVPRGLDNIKSGDILHFVGFWEKPQKSDYEAIKEELETDPEFGLVGVEFDLMEATDDIVKYFMKSIS